LAPSSPLVTVYKTTTCLQSTASPVFFPISSVLQQPPYPIHRHFTVYPPCARAQVCCPAASRLIFNPESFFFNPKSFLFNPKSFSSTPNHRAFPQNNPLTVPKESSDSSWPVITSTLLLVPHSHSFAGITHHVILFVFRALSRRLNVVLLWLIRQCLRLKSSLWPP
jgi:hypothetical protein